MNETPKKVAIDSPHEPVKESIFDYKVKWVRFNIDKKQRQIDAIEQDNASTRIQTKGLQVAIDEFESMKLQIEQDSLSEDGDDGTNVTPVEQVLITHYEEKLNELKQQHGALLSILNNVANQKVLLVNERDKGLDRLIDFYEIKLSPLENTLKALEKNRRELDMQFSIAEVQYKRSMSKLQVHKRKFESAQAQLTSIGASPESLKVMQQIWQTLSITAQSLNLQRQNLTNKIAVVQADITALNVQADTLRDEREALMRMKARRPIDDRATRERFGERSTVWHEGVATDTVSYDVEVATEELYTLQQYIDGLNSALNVDGIDEHYKAYVVSATDFYSIPNLSADSEFGMSDFIDLLKQYYSLRNVADTDTINQTVNTIYPGVTSS